MALYYTWNSNLTEWSCGYDFETSSNTGIEPTPTVSKFQVTLDENVPKTWDGYKAVLTDGFYTFEENLTTALSYGTAFNPTVGAIFNQDATVAVKSLYLDPGMFFVPNDEDTIIFYYPPESQGSITNLAAGASRLLKTPTINSLHVTDGKIVFDGNGYIQFPDNTFPDGVFGDGEWTMDVWYELDWSSRATQIIFGRGENPRYDIFVDEIGTILVGGGPTLVNEKAPENSRRFTLEVWDNNGTLTWTSYINGVKQREGTWTHTNLRTAEMWLGGDPTSGTSRNIIGNIAHFSIRAKADHRGQNFEVAENPYV
jgi:hypothetical protein